MRHYHRFRGGRQLTARSPESCVASVDDQYKTLQKSAKFTFVKTIIDRAKDEYCSLPSMGGSMTAGTYRLVGGGYQCP